jgi:hypothetical protein
MPEFILKTSEIIRLNLRRKKNTITGKSMTDKELIVLLGISKPTWTKYKRLNEFPPNIIDKLKKLGLI